MTSESPFPLAGLGCLGLVMSAALAAIALPNLPWLMGHTSRDVQAEAQINVGTILRAQQVHYIENGSFSATLEALEAEIGISVEASDYYDYSMKVQPDHTRVIVSAAAKNGSPTSYTGAVYVFDDDSATAVLDSLICKSEPPTLMPPPPPIIIGLTPPALDCVADPGPSLD